MQYIPLDNSPNQNFNVTLDINGKNVVYNLFLSYNTDHYWTMQVRDRFKNPITDNIPLLSGQNLFQGLDYLGIGEAFLLKTSDINEEIPDYKNLDSDFILIWRGNR